jgi:hypothetical protein
MRIELISVEPQTTILPFNYNYLRMIGIEPIRDSPVVLQTIAFTTLPHPLSNFH